jgi:hypothetical protein
MDTAPVNVRCLVVHLVFSVVAVAQTTKASRISSTHEFAVILQCSYPALGTEHTLNSREASHTHPPPPCAPCAASGGQLPAGPGGSLRDATECNYPAFAEEQESELMLAPATINLDKSDNKSLISADRNNKATLLLTILRCTSKSSAKDLSPLINTLLSAGKHPRPFRLKHRCQPAMVQRLAPYFYPS